MHPDAINLDKRFVSLLTLFRIMLPSPKESEGDHAPDLLSSMTTETILAAIDEEIARLHKMRALLVTVQIPVDEFNDDPCA